MSQLFEEWKMEEKSMSTVSVVAEKKILEEKKSPDVYLETISSDYECSIPEEARPWTSEEDIKRCTYVSCYRMIDALAGEVFLYDKRKCRVLSELSDEHVKSLCEGQTIEIELPRLAKSGKFDAESGSIFSLKVENFWSNWLRVSEEQRIAQEDDWVDPLILYIDVEQVKSLDKKKSKDVEICAKSVEGEKPSKSVGMKAF